MLEESTTHDLVELTRQLIDAGNRRDLDAAMSLFAADVVWESWDGVGVFEGARAVRGFLGDWLSSYEVFEIELEEILDMGDGITFAVGRQGGRLLGAAGRVEGRSAWAATWEHGLAIHLIASSMDIAGVRAAAERLAASRG
jgi:ketosteroid isomerase-like protein